LKIVRIPLAHYDDHAALIEHGESSNVGKSPRYSSSTSSRTSAARARFLVINNIINKVFWVTVIALLAWLAVGLYGKSTSGGASSENVSTIYGQNVKPADLPPELTNPVQ
jgi:hypothetical protein